MSKVYSFRLDDDNPREAQAREAIEAWVKKGYSMRYIIVDALIGFYIGDERSFELEKILTRFTSLLDKLDASNFSPKKKQSNNILPGAFLESIAKSVKPGEKPRT